MKKIFKEPRKKKKIFSQVSCFVNRLLSIQTKEKHSKECKKREKEKKEKTEKDRGLISRAHMCLTSMPCHFRRRALIMRFLSARASSSSQPFFLSSHSGHRRIYLTIHRFRFLPLFDQAERKRRRHSSSFPSYPSRCLALYRAESLSMDSDYGGIIAQ